MFLVWYDMRVNIAMFAVFFGVGVLESLLQEHLGEALQ
jgi:hypothetical protein